MFRWPCLAAFACSILAGTAAAQPADPKTNFVQALGEFSLALRGSYGDEGPRILDSLDTVERAASQWDEAIRDYEAEVAKRTPADPRLAASMHVGLGGLYLDRARYADAIREFDTAIALDGARPDLFALRGLASTAARDIRGAALSFRKSLDLDPGDTARTYLWARALAEMGDADGAKAAFTRVVDNQQRQARGNVAAVAAPFMRFGIVDEKSGVEPFFPPAAYTDGFVRLTRGDVRGAIVQLRAAARRDAVVSGTADRSYAVRRAAAAMLVGDVATAVVQLKAAVEVYPDAAEPLRLLGLAYLRDDKYEQAAATLRHAIGLDPSDERSRLALAEVLMAAEQDSDAEKALRETIGAIPASGRAHYELARLLQRHGRQAEASDELQQAAAFNPLLGLNGLCQTLGALNAALQRFDAAVEWYSRRIEILPNDAGAHQDLGDTYARLGRDVEALAEFSVALLLEPQRARAFAAIAQTRLRNGEYEAAAEAARRAVDLDPTAAQAHYTLATALLRLDKADEGQKELETFQRLQNAAAEARARELELGGIRREASVSSAAGDHRKAVALLRRALAIAPNEMVSHLNLGIALMLAGEPAEAVERFKSALALNGPDDIHERLAQAYSALGRADDSRREMQTFAQLKQARLERQGAER